MKLSYIAFKAGISLFLICGTSASADNIFVSDSSDGTIVQFDSSGNESVFASGLNNPGGLALDGGGNLYLANSGAGTILRFTSSGTSSVFASGLNDPTGLAFDGNGNLYVADQGDGTIWRFGLNGNGSVFATGLGVNYDPTYLTFAGGNLYATTTYSVEKFDATGNSSTILSTFNCVYGIAADNSGDLYAGVQNSGSIIRFLGAQGPATPFQYPFPINPYELDPFGLAFDQNGNLYATFGQLTSSGSDSGGIMEFNSEGVGTVFATGLSYGGCNAGPDYIAVQNTRSIEFVPEPASTALISVAMLVGLALRGTLQNRAKANLLQRLDSTSVGQK